MKIDRVIIENERELGSLFYSDMETFGEPYLESLKRHFPANPYPIEMHNLTIHEGLLLSGSLTYGVTDA